MRRGKNAAQINDNSAAAYRLGRTKLTKQQHLRLL